MTITIELPVGIEEALLAESVAQGRPAQEIAQEVAATALADRFDPEVEQAHRRAASFREWAESHRGRSLPAIPVEELRRTVLHDVSLQHGQKK